VSHAHEKNNLQKCLIIFPFSLAILRLIDLKLLGRKEIPDVKKSFSNNIQLTFPVAMF